jgi:hypothetical protein
MDIDEAVAKYPPLPRDTAALEKLKREIDEFLAKQIAAQGKWIFSPATFWSDADETAVVYGEHDARTSDDTPPARSCHVDGHVWVDTGMLRSWCRWCQEDAEWSRVQGQYLPRHQVARRFDA